MTWRDTAQQAVDDLCGAKLCEINSMSSRREMIRLVDLAIAGLRAQLAQPEPQHKLTDDQIGRIWFDARIPGLVESDARRLIRAAEAEWDK